MGLREIVLIKYDLINKDDPGREGQERIVGSMLRFRRMIDIRGG